MFLKTRVVTKCYYKGLVACHLQETASYLGSFLTSEESPAALAALDRLGIDFPARQLLTRLWDCGESGRQRHGVLARNLKRLIARVIHCCPLVIYVCLPLELLTLRAHWNCTCALKPVPAYFTSEFVPVYCLFV